MESNSGPFYMHSARVSLLMETPENTFKAYFQAVSRFPSVRSPESRFSKIGQLSAPS